MHANDIRKNATIGQKVIAGSLDTLTPGSRTVAIGARLAEALGVKLGSDISLVSPQGQATPFGTVPRIVKYTVGAVFAIGIYDSDKTYVAMPMDRAEERGGGKGGVSTCIVWWGWNNYKKQTHI